MYWAQALAAQTDDAALAARFAPLAKQLAENEKARGSWPSSISAATTCRAGPAGHADIGRLLPSGAFFSPS
jgi:monomeric isocitrate dehydrogenase